MDLGGNNMEKNILAFLKNSISDNEMRTATIEQGEDFIILETQDKVFPLIRDILQRFGKRGQGIAGGGIEVYTLEGGMLLSVCFRQNPIFSHVVETRIYLGPWTMAY